MLTLWDSQYHWFDWSIKDSSPYIYAAEYYFNGVWKESGKDELMVLTVLAHGDAAGLTLEELRLQLPLLETLEKAVERLRHRDVVEVDSTTGRVYFLVKLNRNWVRNTHPGSR